MSRIVPKERDIYFRESSSLSRIITIKKKRRKIIEVTILDNTKHVSYLLFFLI